MNTEVIRVMHALWRALLPAWMRRPRWSGPAHQRAQAALVAAILLGMAAGNLYANTYTITDLGTLGGSSSSAYGINNSGQVVGQSRNSSGAQRAFLYSGGGMTDLGTLGGVNSYARGINDAGQVVGIANNSSGLNHAFLYSAGAMTDLGTLGGDSYAYGINNSGQATGCSNNRAVLYSAGGITDLGLGDGGLGSCGYGINSSGQVTGYSPNESFVTLGFLYTPGAPVVQFGANGSLDYSSGYGINQSGQVAAGVDIGANTHAFLYAAGALTDLGTLGGNYSGGNGINNSGQVVGAAQTSGFVNHAFLFSGGAMLDLNSLLPVGSSFSVLTTASGINDLGQIVGTGKVAGVDHAFLLSPTSDTPEPATLALFCGGLAALAFARRRLRGCATQK